MKPEPSGSRPGGRDPRRRSHLRVRIGASIAGVAGVALLATVLTGTQASATPSAHSPSSESSIVGTDDGAVQGAQSGGMQEFLGIPYAAAPVGALRWRPPAAPAHWSGVRQATTFGPDCAQPASPFGIASTSENCLYLNVYAPAGTNLGGSGLTVMVWLHGGAYTYGESNDFNPAPLVKDGVIVVTVNYRLGALGFLADSALPDSANGASGNYGLMDQQAALRWVQSNIGQFGGKQGNVTLFGQSAGGFSVLSQMASPGAQGLFDRAIVESPLDELADPSLADAEAQGQGFAQKAGCAQQAPAALAACLRALPVTTILADENQNSYVPNVDGLVLPESIKAAFTDGSFLHVPVLQGTNHDEYSLFVGLSAAGGVPVDAADYQEYIAGTLGVSAQQAAVIAAQYPLASYASPAAAFTALVTDGLFSCNARSADEQLSAQVPTYAYEFNDTNAPMRYLPSFGFPYGASHTDEIQYLFDLTAPIPATLTPAQQTLAAQMQAYWADFAEYGAPLAPGQPSWPRFQTSTEPVMSLNTPAPQVESNLASEHQCAFWSSLG